MHSPTDTKGTFLMRLRNLLILGAGIAIGYAARKRLNEDDPAIVKGPQRSQNPSVRLVRSQTQRLTDQATVRSLDAIRRARGAIRNRLGDEYEDDAAWN